MANNIDFKGEIKGYMYNKYPWLMKSLETFQASFLEGYFLSIREGKRDEEFEIYIWREPLKAPWHWFHTKRDSQREQKREQKYREILDLLCTAFTSSGVDKVVAFAKLNSISLKENRLFDIPNVKIRLLNSQNKLFFDHLYNLYYKDDDLYVSNQVASMEKVNYAGMDLGIRDRNGERLYEGDIVLAKANEERGGRRFWGLAAELGNTGKPNGNINQIVLYHGGDSFPSYLTWAVEFEIQTNFFVDSHCKIKRSRDFDYKYDWRPYEERCEKRAEVLGWPKY